MKIGIIGTADIAFRRFLPALGKCPEAEYTGVASRTPKKTEAFIRSFGGRGYASYDELLEDESVDAVYVPLPPALHYEWGRRVLLAGKHLFMEKPFTTSLRETEELLRLAEERNLAVHENYMFLYHSQLAYIQNLIADGTLGELRSLRMSFGFPKRSEDDFRYNRSLGGGALLDCGGYPVRLAWELLGANARVTQAKLTQPQGFEVDLYGSAVLENQDGLAAQVSFGMDNAYQCKLEVWGSRATLTAPRIFTAGADFKPQVIVQSSEGESVTELLPCDSFAASVRTFMNGTEKDRERATEREKIRTQAVYVEKIREMGRRPQ